MCEAGFVSRFQKSRAEFAVYLDCCTDDLSCRVVHGGNHKGDLFKLTMNIPSPFLFGKDFEEKPLTAKLAKKCRKERK